MRRILTGMVAVLALASLAQSAELTAANIFAIQKNWARTIDTITDAIAFAKADLMANHTRAIAINDAKGAGDQVALGILRDSVNVNLSTIARPFVENSMRAMANVFRDPNLRPTGATGTVYTNFGAFVKGEFASTERLAPEVAQVWRGIFGNGSLDATICAAPVGTIYAVFTFTGATTSTKDTVPTPFDTDLYNGGLLTCSTTTQIVNNADNAADTITLRGKDANGSVWTGTAILTDSAAVGTLFDVTPSVAGNYPAFLDSVVCNRGTSGVILVKVRPDYTYTQ